MTLTAVLSRMGRDDMTAHGFRSTFRDWAGETTAHPREVIEAALAHRLKDKAEAAYARGDLFVKRRRLMEDWASFWPRRRAMLWRRRGSPLRHAHEESNLPSSTILPPDDSSPFAFPVPDATIAKVKQRLQRQSAGTAGATRAQ